LCDGRRTGGGAPGQEGSFVCMQLVSCKAGAWWLVMLRQLIDRLWRWVQLSHQVHVSYCCVVR
jgi:hypothetical protein